MNRSERLHLISRLCYYLAWLSLLVAAVGHVTKLNALLLNTFNISGRNLLEACLVLFIACIASEARISA